MLLYMEENYYEGKINTDDEEDARTDFIVYSSLSVFIVPLLSFHSDTCSYQDYNRRESSGLLSTLYEKLFIFLIHFN